MDAEKGAAKIQSGAGGCFRFYCNRVCQWILNVRYTRREILQWGNVCKCVCACLCPCVFDPTLLEYKIPAWPEEQHIFPVSSNLRHSEGLHSSQH